MSHVLIELSRIEIHKEKVVELLFLIVLIELSRIEIVTVIVKL